MPQNLITGWIQIATSGATIDGRTIDAQDLRDMAESYSTATYTAVIRFEHIRYFGNFGDVAAVKTEDVADGKVGLFAQLRPNQRLLELNREGQALFTSVEIQPDFAGTGKAYLNALAVTDEPASLGTQRLHFSRRRSTPDNYFAAPVALPDLEECLPDQDAESNAQAFFASLVRLLPGFNKLSKDETTPMDSKTAEAFAAAVDKLNSVASSLESSASTFAAQQVKPAADVTEQAQTSEGITSKQFNQLKTSLDQLAEQFNTALNKGQGQSVPRTTGAIEDEVEPVY